MGLRPDLSRRRRAAELALVGGLLLASGLGGLGWSWLQTWRPGLTGSRPADNLPADNLSALSRLAAALAPRTLAGPAALVTRTPFQPFGPSATPFRPLAATLAPLPPTYTPSPSPTPGAEFAALFAGQPLSPVALHIEPPQAVNAGRAIAMRFTPAGGCLYGSGQACLSRHLGGQVTLLTVHSGLGGEGEPFRRAVEGTGLNMAFFSLAHIQRNLAALSGAPVRLELGGQARDDLQLAAVVRVPPARLDDYFNRPFSEALAAAAQESPALRDLLAAGSELLIFEICGWQLPGEAWFPGVSPTTGSVYLGVIRTQ